MVYSRSILQLLKHLLPCAAATMSHTRLELSDGWSFKQSDSSSDGWLSVKKMPTQIHMDLLNHKKCVTYFALNQPG